MQTQLKAIVLVHFLCIFVSAFQLFAKLVGSSLRANRAALVGNPHHVSRSERRFPHRNLEDELDEWYKENEAKDYFEEARSIISGRRRWAITIKGALEAARQAKLVTKPVAAKYNLQEKVAVKDFEEDELFSSKSFSHLGVFNTTIINNLDKMGIRRPTRIQEVSIPLLLNGNEAVMQAQTGSGKTLAYLLPLSKIIDPAKKKPQAIIIAPSRELVHQIASVSKRLFEGMNITTVPIIGGTNPQNQVKLLKTIRPHIVVATPGRLCDMFFRRKAINLSMLRALIIDEVDHLMYEPFIDEVKTLLDDLYMFNTVTGRMRRNHHYNNISNIDNKFMICLCSATSLLNPKVIEFANRYLIDDYKNISISNWQSLPSTIKHVVYTVKITQEVERLRKLLKSKPFVKSALIFVNSQHNATILHDKLSKMGINIALLHGNIETLDRKDIILKLRDGRIPYVITNELSARGLDLPQLSHVINYDLPTDHEHYIHRAGRCGRAGREGTVINFVTANSRFILNKFAKNLMIPLYESTLTHGELHIDEKPIRIRGQVLAIEDPNKMNIKNIPKKSSRVQSFRVS